MENKNEGDSLWRVNRSQQYYAINELIEESRANGTYYTLLVLSSVIIAAGVLLANSSILIGGMLVTPVLTPVLLVALSITAGRSRLLKRTAILILKSIGVIFLVSFLAGLAFDVPKDSEFFQSSLFNNSLRAAFLYFLVAFSSGIAATFSWVRKEVTNILPGISIAVSLVPPISMVAIWLASGDLELTRFFFIVVLFNLFGVIMGSLIVFSLLRFYKSEYEIIETVDRVIEEEEEKIVEKELRKAEEKLD
jgi:uncharacterized hydrophobic protein (TIGR00271 family)